MEQHTPQEEIRRIIISDQLFRSSFGVPLVPLWLSYRSLKWIRSAFEEGSKVMLTSILFTNMGSSVHKASLLVPRTYVHEVMNIGSLMKPCKVTRRTGEQAPVSRVLFYDTETVLGDNVFIRRGGSWWHEAKNCRVSRRYPSDHSKKTSGLGLRVVIRNNVK